MSAPSPAALRLEGVGREFQTGAGAVRALEAVDLEIAHGEFVAILGASGSGKSTLLSLMGALDSPSEGRVRVEGVDLETLNPLKRAELRRRSLGFVFQDYNLLPQLTALENVALPLELDGRPQKAARADAFAAMEALGLAALRDRFPDDLSGGEQQRVAIARAFVGPRRILLADEPTGALDSMTAELVLRLIRARCDAGDTAVLVTHNGLHAAWADRILMLSDGRLSAVEDSRARSLEPRLVR